MTADNGDDDRNRVRNPIVRRFIPVEGVSTGSGSVSPSVGSAASVAVSSDQSPTTLPGV